MNYVEKVDSFVNGLYAKYAVFRREFINAGPYIGRGIVLAGLTVAIYRIITGQYYW